MVNSIEIKLSWLLVILTYKGSSCHGIQTKVLLNFKDKIYQFDK